MFKLSRRFRRNTLAPASLSPSSSTSSLKRPQSRKAYLEDQTPEVGEVLYVENEQIQGQPEGTLHPVLYYTTCAGRLDPRPCKIALSALMTNAGKYEGAGAEFQMDILTPYDEEIKKIMSDKDLQGKENRKKKRAKLEAVREKRNVAVRRGKGWRILLWFEDRTSQRGLVKAILTHRDVFMGERKHKTVFQSPSAGPVKAQS